MRCNLRKRLCRRQENVFWLQVTVDDVLKVEMSQGHQDLRTVRGEVVNISFMSNQNLFVLRMYNPNFPSMSNMMEKFLIQVLKLGFEALVCLLCLSLT